jgi:hypothetical protein
MKIKINVCGGATYERDATEEEVANFAALGHPEAAEELRTLKTADPWAPVATPVAEPKT